MTPSSRPRRRAFTLIELMVVIVVLAILALIAVPSFLSDVKSSVTARDAESLAAFGRDTLSIARSEGSSALPTDGDYTTAGAEMPAVPTAWTVTFSTDASPQPSTGEFDVSVDDADATSSAGLAMATSDGGCVMGLLTASGVTTWNGASASSCDGSVALLGPGASSGGSGGSGGGGGSSSPAPALGTNLGTDTQAFLVDCPAAGDCAVVGTYVDGSGNTQAYVADEAGGTWGEAQPFAVSLVGSSGAAPQNLVCTGVGDCTAVVDLNDGSGIVVGSEVNGTWGTPQEIAGISVEDAYDGGQLACVDAQDCLVSGDNVATGQTPAVVEEVDGTWGGVTPLAEPSGSSGDPVTGSGPVSCPGASLTDCVLMNYESVSPYQVVPYVYAAGTWGPAPAIVSNGQWQNLDGFSCSAVGDCVVVTSSVNSTPMYMLVVRETAGTWAAPVTAVTGSALLMGPNGMTCPSASSCLLVGADYGVSGTPSTIDTLTGTTITQVQSDSGAVVTPIACADVSDCATVGYQTSGAPPLAAAQVEAGGVWGAPQGVGGTGGGELDSVSCPAAGSCVAVGLDFNVAVGSIQSQVVALSGSTWSLVSG